MSSLLGTRRGFTPIFREKFPNLSRYSPQFVEKNTPICRDFEVLKRKFVLIINKLRMQKNSRNIIYKIIIGIWLSSIYSIYDYLSYIILGDLF